MWKNIKYYALAFAIILVGAVVSTGLQLVEGSLPVGHPASALAANLSGVTIGGIIMVIGFLRDSRLEEERRRAEEERQRAEEQRQRAEEEHQRAEEQRQRAEEQRQQAEEQRQRAEAAEARIQQAQAEAEERARQARAEAEDRARQARAEAEDRARQARAEAEERARQERERADRYLEEMIRINQTFMSATERLVQRLPDINGKNGEDQEPRE